MGKAARRALEYFNIAGRSGPTLSEPIRDDISTWPEDLRHRLLERQWIKIDSRIPTQKAFLDAHRETWDAWLKEQVAK